MLLDDISTGDIASVWEPATFFGETDQCTFTKVNDGSTQVAWPSELMMVHKWPDFRVNGYKQVVWSHGDQIKGFDRIFHKK